VTPGFADEILNSLSAHIAVLDAHGSIVRVNEAWKRFARENGGDEASYIGTNYLAVCEDAVRCGGNEAAEAILLGIRNLLSGKQSSFSIEYPCHSTSIQRWFTVHISQFSYKGATYLLTAHEDITARKEAEDKLRESEATLRSVLAALPVGVWIMNQKGQIVHGNPAGQQIWAGSRYVTPDQFGEYKGWWLSTGRRIAPEEWAAARAIQTGETSIDEEIRIECFDGSNKIILNSAMPLRDSRSSIVGAIIVNQDITARKKVEDELHRSSLAIEVANQELQQAFILEQLKARTDELTRLNNRRHFYELSRKMFSLARRYQTPFSVFIFDIDHFKQINDKYGHQFGDTVLRHVAQVIREHVRETDVAARYGGEEFIVALPNTTVYEALAAAEHLREEISISCGIADGKKTTVTVSVGVVEMMTGEDNLDRLIQRADQALYMAKNAGRNCSRLFSSACAYLPKALKSQ
jgi:diguanylate cyclase (GGDEF)-like protein